MKLFALLLALLSIARPRGTSGLHKDSSPASPGERDVALRRVAEVAIIIDAADEQQRKEASKFASTHFKRLVVHGVPIRKWGSVIAKGLECPTFHPKTDPTHWPDKIIGTTMAHKRIWENFAARNANQTSSDNSPFLIIFEKDAMCAVEDCGNYALDALQSARALPRRKNTQNECS